MTAAWDGRAPAEGWWWVRSGDGAVRPAFFFADGLWEVFGLWTEDIEPASMLHARYTLLGRCEPPGEAELRGWKACQEAADRAVQSWRTRWAVIDTPGDSNAPKHDSRSGGITYGRLQAAEIIATAIRSLTPPKDAP